MTYCNNNIIIGWGAIFSIESLNEFLLANNIECDKKIHDKEKHYVWDLGFQTTYMLEQFGIKCDFYFDQESPKDVFICIEEGRFIMKNFKIRKSHERLQDQKPDIFDRFCHFVSHTIDCGHLVYIQKVI
jgi:hypothetical protein